nr:MAG TPA: hypothetical protein [Caudoviricetes sp.]
MLMHSSTSAISSCRLETQSVWVFGVGCSLRSLRAILSAACASSADSSASCSNSAAVPIMSKTSSCIVCTFRNRNIDQ